MMIAYYSTNQDSILRNIADIWSFVCCNVAVMFHIFGYWNRHWKSWLVFFPGAKSKKRDWDVGYFPSFFSSPGPKKAAEASRGLQDRPMDQRPTVEKGKRPADPRSGIIVHIYSILLMISSRSAEGSHTSRWKNDSFKNLEEERKGANFSLGAWHP